MAWLDSEVPVGDSLSTLKLVGAVGLWHPQPVPGPEVRANLQQQRRTTAIAGLLLRLGQTLKFIRLQLSSGSAELELEPNQAGKTR